MSMFEQMPICKMHLQKDGVNKPQEPKHASYLISDEDVQCVVVREQDVEMVVAEQDG